MKINYFFRSNQAGYSIQSVFNTILNSVGKRFTIRSTYLPSPFASIVAIFKNGLYAHQRQEKNEINHITGDVHYLLYFLNSKRTVVTVHDIMYYHYLKGIKKIIWKWIYIDSLKRASRVTFISEFAKNQILDEIDLPAERICVIPNPVDPSFVYSPKTFNEKQPRILHIGTLERKNLNRTIRALKGITCHLRIIGTLDDVTRNLMSDLGIVYSCASGLTHEQIVSEYQQADIINFPSTFEGFGMPIIEGQATGRLVITSNLSPMKEVAGEGAMLVDPYSVEDIRRAYINIINNPSLRKSLVRKGLENVLKYQVEHIAAQYVNIYTSITNENPT